MIKIFALCALFFGCKKEDNVGPINFDFSVYISFINQDNKDLLDTATTNHFVISNISCFSLINGEKSEFSLGNNISKVDSNYVMRLNLEHEVTYLELDKNITDTIKCEFDKTSTSESITKVWYNGILMWHADGTGRKFTIVK